jgi:predicted aconitase with swiveling domain
MSEIQIRTICGMSIEGKAIVSPIPISFLGDIDSKTGEIVDSKNPLYGNSINGKIFLFPESRGSTVGSYIIYGLKINGVPPLALVVNKAETIVIAGAILADITLVDKPNKDISTIIKTGDILKIDTKRNIIKIKEK